MGLWVFVGSLLKRRDWIRAFAGGIPPASRLSERFRWGNSHIKALFVVSSKTERADLAGVLIYRNYASEGPEKLT